MLILISGICAAVQLLCFLNAGGKPEGSEVRNLYCTLGTIALAATVFCSIYVGATVVK